jgi:hypothetical protein
MKIFAWTIAALAAVGFALSFWADTRVAPLFGAILLLLSIAWATYSTQTSDKNLRRAERAARENRKEREREAAMRGPGKPLASSAEQRDG